MQKQRRKSTWWRACISGLATIGLFLVAPAAFATDVPSGDIMIIAAHPDDDIITSAGVISEATDNRQDVIVAYMTNGDRCETPSQVTEGHCSSHQPGIGTTRQNESVDALVEVLSGDFDEDKMIFLGYPGGFLPYLRNNTPLPPDMPHTATYASRGLDNTDWHDHWNGTGEQHAPYTATALSEDLYELLLAYQPDDIFTHSEFDRHSDHLSTYREVMEAIDEVQDDVPLYDPYVHTTVVHVALPATAGSWPASADPTAWHVPIPFLDHADVSDGELLWASRESFEVPASMQNTNLSQNPKYEAIEAHVTQAPLEGGFIRKFLHRDEVFFVERLGNPEGRGDAYTTDIDGDLSIGATGVLANDVRGVKLGPDTHGPVTASLVSGPAHGSLDLNPDGSFTYTLNTGSQETEDSFSYRPEQGTAIGTDATVDIDIQSPDDPPTADNDGPYGVVVGGTLNVSAGNGVLIGDVDPEGEPLTAVLVSGVAHGALNLQLDGSFTYVNNSSAPTTDSFTYKAVDPGSNESGPATVTLSIVDEVSIVAAISGPSNGAPGIAASFVGSATGGSGAHSYDWTVDLDGTEVATGNKSNLTFTPAVGGVYTVTANVVEGSASDTDSVDFTVFGDIGSSPFQSDIVWLAEEGITRGCNPPANDLFCPEGVVTRGQMAAFLVRALELTDDGGGNKFVDDDGSVFEDDIAKLAAAGITRGCNPPFNDRFCPDDSVTRGQMAAFLVRAFGLTDDGGGNKFVDDDGSIFEDDIAKLAAAGITRGCNPPVNDRFCPDNVVTRGQMAAFLHRGESWLP